MGPGDSQREAPGSAVAESPGEDAPTVQRTADGVHYYFPVDITVVEKQAALGEVQYHFPVEIVMVPAESALDVHAAADLVLDKLATQLESERTSRG